MFYFREEEFLQLDRFFSHTEARAMAIYGRRRTGKTRLLTEYIQKCDAGIRFVYYQCASYDYQACLADFVAEAKKIFPGDPIPSGLSSFRDAISLITRLHPEEICFILDEFPFLAKRDENVPVEFQWIIDHGLNGKKLILTGSNRSFMVRQIQQMEAPLYGRFDEIMEVRPFSFQQVKSLFPSLDDAMKVYTMTGGVAQYVNFFLDYSDIQDAAVSLFFHPDGRLFREAPNMLLQELRDPTTYERILRAIGGGEKSLPQIAAQSGLESKGLSPYLTRLQELHLVAAVENPLSREKRKQRFRTIDALFRFHYTFLEPNLSMINYLRENAADYILDHRYQEFIGVTYEDVVRESCFRYALEGRIPFMPRTAAKWWGPVCRNDAWQESEVDLVAYDDQHLLVGECKYRTKAAGLSELNDLKLKARYIPSGEREVFYLLASRSGFTEDVQALRDPALILIDQI